MGTFLLVFILSFNFFAEIHILIKPTGGLDVYHESLQQDLDTLDGLERHYTAKVPLHKPLTRKQYIHCQSYWPCHFYEDKK